MNETINKISLINRSAVKKHALKVSGSCRAGKFTRVSEEFIDNVESILDDVIRQTLSKMANTRFDSVPVDESSRRLLTDAAREKVASRMEEVLLRIIQLRVESTPSCGVTL